MSVRRPRRRRGGRWARMTGDGTRNAARTRHSFPRRTPRTSPIGPTTLVARIHPPAGASSRRERETRRAARAGRAVSAIAVGPSADRYVRRFLAFERTGRGRPGWHWPSLLFPGVWAFYRKMWLTGRRLRAAAGRGRARVRRALAHVRREADVRVDRVARSLAVWILPGVAARALRRLPALRARARRSSGTAERGAKSARDAVQRLAELAPTSTWPRLAWAAARWSSSRARWWSRLRAAYVDLGIRAQRRAGAAVGARRSRTRSRPTWYVGPPAAAAVRPRRRPRAPGRGADRRPRRRPGQRPRERRAWCRRARARRRARSCWRRAATRRITCGGCASRWTFRRATCRRSAAADAASGPAIRVHCVVRRDPRRKVRADRRLPTPRVVAAPARAA